MGYQPMHDCGSGFGEIKLQTGSPCLPLSDGLGSPPAVAAEPSGSGEGGLHHQQRQLLRFCLFKCSGSDSGSVDIELGLGIGERRKLGNVLFVAFCGVCLDLGVGKIWAGGWFALAGDDRESDLQLCDEMIFNFDPPVCLNCEDCGGPLRCGTGCSALVSKNIGGYDVCTTIGKAPKSQIYLIDENKPQKGVIVKMFSPKCSISISVLCDSTIVQVSDKFPNLLGTKGYVVVVVVVVVSDKFILSGNCDYATTLRHPSGCAKSVSVDAPAGMDAEATLARDAREQLDGLAGGDVIWSRGLAEGDVLCTRITLNLLFICLLR